MKKVNALLNFGQVEMNICSTLLKTTMELLIATPLAAMAVTAIFIAKYQAAISIKQAAIIIIKLLMAVKLIALPMVLTARAIS